MSEQNFNSPTLNGQPAKQFTLAFLSPESNNRIDMLTWLTKRIVAHRLFWQNQIKVAMVNPILRSEGDNER